MEKLNEVREWHIKNDNIRKNMKDEVMDKTIELIETYGKKTDNDISFIFEEEPCIMDMEYCDNRYIKRIDRNNMELYYGNSNYDYINYDDLDLDQRMYLLDEIIYQLLD